MVAALSSAAKLVREAGGFTAQADDPVLIGQIQVLNVPDPAHAAADLLSRREEIIRLANSIHPAHGGAGRAAWWTWRCTGAPCPGGEGENAGAAPAGRYPRRDGRQPGQQHVRGRVRAGGKHERGPGLHAHPVEPERSRPGQGGGRDSGASAWRQGAKRRGRARRHRHGGGSGRGRSLPRRHPQQGNHERRRCGGAGHRQRLAGD